MSVLLIKLLLSYLLGSVVGSLLLGRLRGVDIREHGSGNAGSTNALRTQGKLFALGTALIDFGKGVVAALVIAPFNGFGASQLDPVSTALACGFAAAIGHCYPVFHGFRGGKGAGTLFGAFAALFPLSALATLALWLLVVATTGYVGLGTVIAGLALPLILALVEHSPAASVLALAGAAGIFLAFTHRSNLQRLLAGTENRFERARIFARDLPRPPGT